MRWSQKCSRSVLFAAVVCLLAAPAQSQVELLDAAVISRDLDYVPDVEYPNDWDLLDVFMPEGADDVPSSCSSMGDPFGRVTSHRGSTWRRVSSLRESASFRPTTDSLPR